jgi:hypothetical protein
MATTNDVRIQQFKEENMYVYEKAGRMETIIGHWDLITFINITELTKEFDFLEYDFKQFKELCINATTELDDFIPQCRIATEMIEKDLIVMRERKILMEETVDFQHNQVRSKRGLGNFLGTVQNYLYGTMDYKDRIYYDHQLKSLRKNEETLKIDRQEQITIIKTIYQLANQTYADLNDDLSKINDRVTNITDWLAQIWDTESELKLDKLIESILTNIILTKNDLMKKQDTIFHLLANPTAPSLSHIITPSVFIQEMKRIEKAITTGYSLPFPATEKFIFQIYRMTRTKLSKFADTILCKI